MKHVDKLALNYIRVVVFGTWSADWISALGPDSDLWTNHPIVKEVLVLPNERLHSIPPPQNADLLTVILPLMEWHIVACPKNYASLISSEKVINTLSKKDQFFQYIYQMGLLHLIPRCYQNISEITFPLILKRVDLSSGLGIELVKSAAQLAELSQQSLWSEKPALFQEYIPSDKDYVTHMICENGQIVWHTSFEYTLISPDAFQAAKNIKEKKRVLVSKDLLLQFCYCLEPLKFNGPCNIDFKFSPEGDLKILEINPRFGGSLMLYENRDLLKEAINCLLMAAVKKNLK